MNEATVVAAEIQDLASAVGDVAEAVRKQPASQVTVNVPEQPAPVVNVEVAAAVPPAPVVQVNVPQQAAPVVNVAAPEVTLTPTITLQFPPPNAYRAQITERDSNGFIVAFVLTPE